MDLTFLKTPQFYNDNATKLAEQYLSKTFEEVHQSWSPFLPSIIENPNARSIISAYTSRLPQLDIKV